MNIITGYISSTSGNVIVNGNDILKSPEKVKKDIGYLPDTPPLYVDMKVLEYLNFVAEIKGVKKSERKAMVQNVMETVNITDMSQRLIKHLSKGYCQRVGIAQALIGSPKVLILDEPTVGLDPKQIIEVRDLIKSLGEKHTIILSSHILSEVSAVCDRVIIINKGEIVASDTKESLSKSLQEGNKMLVRIKGNQQSIERAFEGQVKALTFEGSVEEGTIDVVLEGYEDKDIRELIFNTLSQNNLPIYMMKSLNLTLEEIFLQVTSGEFKQEETEEQATEQADTEQTNNEEGIENAGDSETRA